jgi:WD40 repeat protein
MKMTLRVRSALVLVTFSLGCAGAASPRPPSGSGGAAPPGAPMGTGGTPVPPTPTGGTGGTGGTAAPAVDAAPAPGGSGESGGTTRADAAVNPLPIGSAKPAHRYIYAATGGTINVYDIDNGHKKVKSIPVPGAGGDLRGACGDVPNHAIYLSYFGGGKVVAIDLQTDKVMWTKAVDPGADRGEASPDGTKLFVPAGENFNAPWNYELDPKTGTQLAQFMVTNKAHDSNVGASGKYAYLETKSSPIVTVVDLAANKPLRNITFSNIAGPHAVDSSDRYIYANVFQLFGFEVADVTTGKVVASVEAMDVKNPGNGGEAALRNHGIALKPDETELWEGSKYSSSLFVFDLSTMPPKQIKRLTIPGYGFTHWITFSIDGSYAYPSPDQHSSIPVQVFDTRTYAPVATIGYSEDLFEVDFSADNQVVAMGSQYGNGRKPNPQ